ncbi:MAG TPA: hypothetical protein VN642_02280 [Dongiaceae bacterium]|nr:hypothetical protein [Dongiaceae bacterium]
MIRRICFSILFLFPAISAYAGHGTIQETDTEIIIEYYGDDADKLITRAVVEAREKEIVQQEKVVEIRKAKIDRNASRNAEHRKVEEE